MVPIPRIIRDAARFGYQCAVNWTWSRTCTETTPERHNSFKLTDLSRESRDKWLLSAVTIILFGITAMGFVAWFYFWGRDRHPRQTASPEDKTALNEIDEFPDEEERSDGWYGFILACHAAITLGAGAG
ncbi:uncharacterized protein N7515_009667 [Penicillium bovifimosum]|uniref:Uncharacterized protein n=1 Tax=Penicillium bovifimosum TaxID=126998 RepID=A0A9W9KUK2_9EURO|nr:uncharacterized protein N7515_009667 [Penicillium bovifimosum]KAJ5120279.1 hypothetical protein N7515_009667 [Penicillium bovifimosum]